MSPHREPVKEGVRDVRRRSFLVCIYTCTLSTPNAWLYRTTRAMYRSYNSSGRLRGRTCSPKGPPKVALTFPCCQLRLQLGPNCFGADLLSLYQKDVRSKRTSTVNTRAASVKLGRVSATRSHGADD